MLYLVCTCLSSHAITRFLFATPQSCMAWDPLPNLNETPHLTSVAFHFSSTALQQCFWSCMPGDYWKRSSKTPASHWAEWLSVLYSCYVLLTAAPDWWILSKTLFHSNWPKNFTFYNFQQFCKIISSSCFEDFELSCMMADLLIPVVHRSHNTHYVHLTIASLFATLPNLWLHIARCNVFVSRHEIWSPSTQTQRREQKQTHSPKKTFAWQMASPSQGKTSLHGSFLKWRLRRTCSNWSPVPRKRNLADREMHRESCRNRKSLSSRKSQSNRKFTGANPRTTEKSTNNLDAISPWTSRAGYTWALRCWVCK